MAHASGPDAANLAVTFLGLLESRSDASYPPRHGSGSRGSWPCASWMRARAVENRARFGEWCSVPGTRKLLAKQSGDGGTIGDEPETFTNPLGKVTPGVFADPDGNLFVIRHIEPHKP